MIKINSLKIKSKMTFFISATIFILLTLLFIFQYFEVKNVMTDQFSVLMKNMVTEKEDEVSLWISDKDLTKIYQHELKDNTNITVKDLDLFKLLMPEQIRSVFVVMASDGKLIDGNGGIAENNGSDLRQTEWYKKGFENDNGYISYSKNEKTNQSDIFITLPLLDSNNKKIGVIGEILNTDQFAKIAIDSKVNGKGYITILTDDYIYVAHPDKSLLGKSALDNNIGDSIKRSFDSNGKDIEKYIFNKNVKYGISNKIDKSNMHIFISITEKEVMENAMSIIYILLIGCVLIFLASVAIVSLLSKKITNPIIQIVKYMNKYSSGDFTGGNDQSLESMHDEIGDMYRALINLRDNFKSIIESIQNTSSIVHKNTEDLAAISVENSSSMEEIGKACEDIANKLLDFSASNQHGLDQLKKLTEAIIHADTVIKNNIVAGIDNSNQIGTDGIHNINVLTQKSNEIENLRQHIAIQIAGIGTETSKLENITSLIEEVSSQINLLSINALIQAAHISENNGFAVIAQEIRKLSERTAEENKNIQTFIRQVGQKVNQLLTDSNSFTSEFNEYNQIITQTEKLFNNLKKSIEMVSTGLSSLVEQSKIINDQQSSVTKIITKNCELSTEFSSTVEEISASVQQYNAASQENLDDINKLEEKAEDFKNSC